MRKEFKAENLIIGVLTIIILVLSILVIIYLIQNSETNIGKWSSEKEGYVASVEYDQENAIWEYIITGEKPSPCHITEQIVNVDPETNTANITLLVTSPEFGVSCAQVIQPVTLNGDFRAAQDVSLGFTVTIDNREDEIRPSPKSIEVKDETVIETDSGLILYANYTENSIWSYEIVGYKANPCYVMVHQVTVAESFPEQVLVKVTVTPPAEDIMCAQVMEEINLTGTFSASENAVIKFEVGLQ